MTSDIPAPAAASLDILLVDDDPLVCERLECLLAAHGMRAVTVSSMELARQTMRAIYFPLVILDRHLGDGDGLDLVREYRARQSGRRVRIIVLSSDESPDLEQATLAAGADAFLSKRIGDEAFVDRVRRLYERACGNKVELAHEPQETARLRALAEFAIMDTADEQAYDDITRIASVVCDAPIALISLVDDKRQWFKSRLGLEAQQTPRQHAFCAHAIQQPSTVFVVPDARTDPRFAENPLVDRRAAHSLLCRRAISDIGRPRSWHGVRD